MINANDSVMRTPRITHDARTSGEVVHACAALRAHAARRPVIAPSNSAKPPGSVSVRENRAGARARGRAARAIRADRHVIGHNVRWHSGNSCKCALFNARSNAFQSQGTRR